MGQKIHPLGLRLHITQRHRSNWCFCRKEYPLRIVQDKAIRDYLFKTYPDGNISDIFISRPEPLIGNEDKIIYNVVHIRIFCIALRLFSYGTRKEQCHRLDSLAFTIGQLLSKGWPSEKRGYIVQVCLRRFETKLSQASAIANRLVATLQLRKPLRPIIKKVISAAQDLYDQEQIKGLRIQISGRINGAEMARTQWVRFKRIPLQTLRANLDYSYKTAKTVYGIIGIKVWTFKTHQVWNYEKKDFLATRAAYRNMVQILMEKIKKGVGTSSNEVYGDLASRYFNINKMNKIRNLGQQKKIKTKYKRLKNQHSKNPKSVPRFFDLVCPFYKVDDQLLRLICSDWIWCHDYDAPSNLVYGNA